jgi:hypothetical protein
MPGSNLFHCLHQPPLAVPPAPTQQMSVSAAAPQSVQTVWLLDPAAPPLGGTQQLATVTYALASSTTVNLCHGRFLTRPLAAQTLPAGNWTFGAVFRINTSSVASLSARHVGGFTVAQWRPGSGVIARAVDSAGGGVAPFPSFATFDFDIPVALSVSGSSLTLAAGDCLCLEVWQQLTTGTSAAGSTTDSLTYGGAEQYVSIVAGASSGFTLGSLTDTDAWLLAPALVTFQ